MNITLGIGPLVALIAGILILVLPRLLNYIVALYLIIIGLLGLAGAGDFHFKQFSLQITAPQSMGNFSRLIR